MKPDIKAKLKYMGSKLPIYSGIRPVAKIKDDYLTSIQIDFEKENILSNRELIDIFVTFITPEVYPNTLWEGKTIQLQDPSNVWGYLTVTEIYNQILSAPKDNKEANLTCNYDNSYYLETLFANTLLWKTEFIMGDQYNDILDQLFLIDTENELLIDLQSYYSDCDKTYSILKEQLMNPKINFNNRAFGKILCGELEDSFRRSNLFLEEFCKQCQILWQLLPIQEELLYEKPFFLLNCCFDDFLPYCSEAEVIDMLHEDLFWFYRD